MAVLHQPSATAAPIGTASPGAAIALGMSTAAFTVCFAVWTIFAIIGIQIQKDLGLNETQFGLLVGTPILTGSLIRLFLGIWADQYGGRIVYHAGHAGGRAGHLAADLCRRPIPNFCSRRSGVGIAGGSFAVGVAYVSQMVSRRRSRARRWASSAPAMSARRSPSSPRPSSWSPMGWQGGRADLGGWRSSSWRCCSCFTTKDDPDLAARRASGDQAAQPCRPAGAAARTCRSGASRSTISSCSAPSWRWRCGCRAI